MSILRKFLFPFAFLYGGIMLLRNFLYDIKVFRSESFPLPVICVGNLSVGGTGKSPMIEYLLKLLLQKYKVATLSRGYGRTTKGFKMVEVSDKASRVGDEPLQFKNKFPKASVAVDEIRTRGIKNLMVNSAPEIILLDDAFQHRKVSAGLNILLTRYEDLYAQDLMLPTGNLREPISGADRAKIIVVTKCPEDLSLVQREKIREKLKIRNYQHLFFSYIGYQDFIQNSEEKIPVEELQKKEVTLVTGIANPSQLCDHLDAIKVSYKHINYPDHHNFSPQEISEISKATFLLTTEKDFMRLKGEIPEEKLFYLPIEMKLLGDPEEFNKDIIQYVIKEK